MRITALLPLLLFCHLTFAQDRSKVDFQKDIRSIKTTLDGKKLIIKSKKWHPTAYGAEVRDYLIYDFESKSVKFLSEKGAFGGFSPNANYFLETKLVYADAKRGPYNVTLLNLNTGEKESWKNENFGLVVYDDGKLLTTKAKTYKGIARVDDFSSLYLYNPGDGAKPKELIGKKEPLGRELYNYNMGLDADPDFFQLLSPDHLSSWGGHLYNPFSYPRFNYYDLEKGTKIEVGIPMTEADWSLPDNLILAVDGKNAIMRRGSRKEKGKWIDFFIRADSKEKLGISNQDSHTAPATYQMVNNRIYQFDSTGTVITRFSINSTGLPFSDKVWYPKISQALIAGAAYKFVVASDQYLVAVPIKRTKEEDQVVIYDLTTDALVDSFTLHKKDKPKKAASTSYTTKKLYKSDLLNSYDRMSLPYSSGNPSGREVTGLTGASNIGSGQVFAIGMIGTTAYKNPILLSLTRYTASNGSVVSTYYVSVFDGDGSFKGKKEIGTVQRSSAGRTYAVVNFKIQREQYNTFTIVGEQQFEQRVTEFKLTIEPSGNIH